MTDPPATIAFTAPPEGPKIFDAATKVNPPGAPLEGGVGPYPPPAAKTNPPVARIPDTATAVAATTLYVALMSLRHRSRQPERFRPKAPSCERRTPDVTNNSHAYTIYVFGTHRRVMSGSSYLFVDLRDLEEGLAKPLVGITDASPDSITETLHLQAGWWAAPPGGGAAACCRGPPTGWARAAAEYPSDLAATRRGAPYLLAVLTDNRWTDQLGEADRRGITPLFWSNFNPYGPLRAGPRPPARSAHRERSGWGHLSGLT